MPSTTTLLLTITSTLPLALTQSCPGTTYKSYCCSGTLLGSSVAIPPASTFPLGTPPPSLPTSFPPPHLPPITHSLPSGFSFPTSLFPSSLFSDLPTDLPTALPTPTDSAAAESYSKVWASILSAASTDTGRVSVLPVPLGSGTDGGLGPQTQGEPEATGVRIQYERDLEGRGLDERGLEMRVVGSLSESSLAPGVTCRGVVGTLGGGSMTETTGMSGGTSMGSSTASETSGTMTGSSAATTSQTASSSGSAVGATSSAASTAGAAVVTGGLGARLGAMLGVGLGVVVGAM